MKNEKKYIDNPDTLVILSINLSCGNKMLLSMPVKMAQETLLQYRKFVEFYSIPVEKRQGLEVPCWMYHFLDGDLARPETLKPRASFLFQNVTGMQYDQIDYERDELAKRDLKLREKMVEITEKHIKDHEEGDDWKKGGAE